MSDQIQSVDQATKPMRKWRCTVCGYIYEGAELPDDFTCPLCGVGADEFEEVTDED